MSMATGSSKTPDHSMYSTLYRIEQRADPTSRFIFTSRPASTEDRIIIQFEPTATCSGGSGFVEQDRLRAPPRLAALGITDTEWRRFTEKLESDVQPHTLGVLSQFLLVVLFIASPLICIRDSRYQAALGHWVNELNEQLLRPRGLFGKFQTVQVYSDKYHEEQSWLAIALTADDAEQLRAEPVFWRPACCGTNRLVRDTCQPKFCCCCCCRYERFV
jgi:hypothetical protein